MAAADEPALTPEQLAKEARIAAFEQQAERLVKGMLPAASDGSPRLRELLTTIVGATIQSKQMREKLAAALDDFSLIVERLPDLERRITELEAKRHGG